MFFLGKKYTRSHLPGFVLWYLVYSCLTQFCRLSKKAGILAGAVSGVADLCGISEFHDQYFELK